MVGTSKMPRPTWVELGVPPERAAVSSCQPGASLVPATRTLEKLTTWVITEAGGGKTSEPL